MRRAWSHCTNDGHWNMSQHPERPHSPPHAKTQAELQRPLSPRAILWMSRDAFTHPHIRGDAHNNQQYAVRHRPVKNRWLWQKQRPKLAQKRKLAEPFHVRRPGREAFGTAFGLCSAKAAQGRGPKVLKQLSGSLEQTQLQGDTNLAKVEVKQRSESIGTDQGPVRELQRQQAHSRSRRKGSCWQREERVGAGWQQSTGSRGVRLQTLKESLIWKKPK